MAVDMFLKLDGIKGESKDHKHKDEIHIESFSWGLSQTGSFGAGGGGGAGKVSVHDISVTKNLDKSSPELMLCCCNGKHIKEGLVTVRKAGEKPVEYLKIKLTDILVSSVSHAGHGGGDLLTESLSINVAQFNVEYQEQGEDGKAIGGPIVMGWNVKKNEKA
jgi:type VI secretion system secreted protein Hcp